MCRATKATPGDLKIKPDEISGKTDYDFYPEELAVQCRADDKRVMESGRTEDLEEKYVNDGREMIVRIVRTPVKDEGGNVMGILGIFGTLPSTNWQIGNGGS